MAAPTAVAVAVASERLGWLEVLNVVNCTNLTDQVSANRGWLHNVGTMLTTVGHPEVSRGQLQSIVYAATAFPQLRCLDVYRCGGITEAAVQSFRQERPAVVVRR